MSEHAYDINYLLESDAALVEAPMRRVAKLTPVASPAPCGIAAAQEALARELLQLAEFHDNWISQYERMLGANCVSF
ncbi:hypothetical protein PY254_16410 [Rhodanobacter sp. AS-Z3]|uniref:hypothetical protein n=1 Tax=Rhodanobacter sp. AS-Z3 TaxID=3031330 RepID=UPI0024795B6F|nr:hypothetical protein [Rhodanobacter sp. AS-Z3]WEN14794.1 hypothetical protein PY254_16410 [Rhodanobacter sp. AS-Z3]